MQSVDRGDGGADVGALDVHVALGRGLVHVDVVHAAVLVALLHHVVADLLVPVWLPEKIFTFKYIQIFVNKSVFHSFTEKTFVCRYNITAR